MQFSSREFLHLMGDPCFGGNVNYITYSPEWHPVVLLRSPALVAWLVLLVLRVIPPTYISAWVIAFDWMESSSEQWLRQEHGGIFLPRQAVFASRVNKWSNHIGCRDAPELLSACEGQRFSTWMHFGNYQIRTKLRLWLIHLIYATKCAWF